MILMWQDFQYLRTIHLSHGLHTLGLLETSVEPKKGLDTVHVHERQVIIEE